MINKTRETELASEKKNPVPIHMNGIGTRIERACELAGGKRALAKAADIHETQIYRYIAEGGMPSAGTMVLIANKSGVNLSWLATGDGPELIEDAATPAAQSTQSFDYELLKDVAKAVDRALDDLDLEMTVNHKWDLIDVLYDMHAESQTRPSHANVIRLVRSAS